MLDCWSVDDNDFSLHDASGPVEGLGYNYTDLVYRPIIPPDRAFVYSTNNRTNVKLLGDETINMFLDFRDWKHMSKLHRFNKRISDSDIILGLKEGNITIDFKEMVDQDATGNYSYEIGGRMFFEASVYGLTFTSFTTSGFFDRLGYEEPKRPLSIFESVFFRKVLPITFGVIVALLTTAYKIYQYKEKRRQELREALADSRAFKKSRTKTN